ncbi:uncharacterized protein LOC132336334 [Haemorhous mexicanus]|uniref:uncharacterized protein LOC132336334 n=1 Tax=Haemorhous mexicanus TaxID=30427 RepID=UPI0028BEBA4A|nr:uncharacterized protein LOC132336334 [Haemorhous mexicanus]
MVTRWAEPKGALFVPTDPALVKSWCFLKHLVCGSSWGLGRSRGSESSCHGLCSGPVSGWDPVLTKQPLGPVSPHRHNDRGCSGLGADTAHGRCYSLEAQTGKVSPGDQRSSGCGRRGSRGTRGRGFPGCPVPALFFGAQSSCSPWSTAQPHREAASDGEGVSCGSPFLCSMVVFPAGPPPPCTCSGSWVSPGAAVVVSVGALPQTPPVILSPPPPLLLPAPLESFRHCWGCVLHASCLTPFPAPGMGSPCCEEPLVPPWQGSEGQMPAEHFIQGQVLLHQLNPLLTPSQMPKPKTASCSCEPEPCC